jgi:mono/diheme cytochrome c family protein
MNDLKAIIYGILIGLLVMVVVYVFGLYFLGCQTNNSCSGVAEPERTPIPTLIAATLPAPKVGAEAAPAKPHCRVAALDLIGTWVSAGYKETETFSFTDVAGQNCTANFKDDVQKLFLTPNLWYDGAPACTTCHYADVVKATKNMDLSTYAGILAGSNRVGGKAKGDDILAGGDWGKALLHQMLYAPDGKTAINRPAMPLGRPANVPANGPVISAGAPAGSEAAAVASTPAPTVEVATTPTAEPVEIARPSNPGGPGDAVNLKGDVAVGEQIFVARCSVCHGDQGKAGIPNPGSDDGTVPVLNPIDSTLVSPDYATFATNVDLFIQHGSVPAGSFPAIQMPAWGDQNLLSQQDIANLIAYVISLNLSK